MELPKYLDWRERAILSADGLVRSVCAQQDGTRAGARPAAFGGGALSFARGVSEARARCGGAAREGWLPAVRRCAGYRQARGRALGLAGGAGDEVERQRAVSAGAFPA